MRESQEKVVHALQVAKIDQDQVSELRFLRSYHDHKITSKAPSFKIILSGLHSGLLS